MSTMDDCALAGCCGRTTARTASTVTDEADLGTTGSATVGAGVSGYRVVTRHVHLPSGSLVLCQVLDLLLAHLQLLVKHTALSASVSCYVLPALRVDVQSFHVALADIFVAQLGSANRSYARG